MQQSNVPLPDDFQYYFVTKQSQPGGSIQLALSSYAPFRDDLTTLSFDTEEDADLYILQEHRGGAEVSTNDIAIANAIIDGEPPLFLYEEQLLDGKLLLSLHDSLPPHGSGIIAFGSRSYQLVARLL